MKYIKGLIGFLLILSLLLFIRNTDFSKVAASVQKIGFNFMVVFSTTIAAYFFGTIGWRYCLGQDGAKIGVWRLFIIRHVGETVGVINPTSIVGGDALKVFMLKTEGIEQKAVLTSVLVSRLVMVISQLFLFLMALVLVFATSGRDALPAPVSVSTPAYAPPFLIVGVIAIGVALCFAWWRLRYGRSSATTVRTITQGLQNVKRALAEARAFCVVNKRSVALSFLFFSVHWIFGSLEFYFILRFLGFQSSVIEGLFIDMGVVFFKAAGAFIPGQVGIEEYGNKVMLAITGIVAAEIWITASLLRRARQAIWLLVGLGAYALIRQRSPVNRVNSQ